MGLSLRNLTRNIRDIFDANTQADQQRRVAQGQPQFYNQQHHNPIANVVNQGQHIVAGAARPVIGTLQPWTLLNKGVREATQSYARGPLNVAASIDQGITGHRPNSVNNPIFGNAQLQPVQNIVRGSYRQDKNPWKAGLVGGAQLLSDVSPLLPVGGATAKAVPKVRPIAQEFRTANQFGAVGKNVNKTPLPRPSVTPKALPSSVKPTVKPAGQGTKTANNYMDEQLKSVGIDPSSATYKQRRLNIVRAPLDKYADAVDALRSKVGKGLTAAQSSESGVISKAANAPRTVFSRFGMSDATRSKLNQFSGSKTASGQVSLQLKEKIGKMLGPNDSLDRIKMHLQDKKFVERMYGPGTKKVAYSELTPNEKAVVDHLKALRTQHNDINYEMGLINESQFARGQSGEHAARIFDVNSSNKSFGRARVIDKSLSKKRTDIGELTDDLLDRNYDEITSTAIRNEVVLRNKAAIDVLDGLKKDGLIKETAPNSNWVKLDGRYGKYKDHYADRQVATELADKEIFASQTGQATRNLLDAYLDNPIGKLDRIQKSFKTTLSPGTIGGNIASNLLLFARGSRINPLTHAKNTATSYGRLTMAAQGKFDRGIYNAQKSGLDIGTSRTGFELNGIDTSQLATTTKASKNPLAVAGRSYGRFDDAHKLAMWEELQRRGMSAEKAAQRTNLFSQDYNNVGRLINLFADSPLLGKPFARFSVELLRLSKNAALYNPVGMAAGLGAFAIIQNKLSEKAGESPQDRKLREQAVGQTTLPGTAWINKLAGGPDSNLSLNLPIGDNAVNIARMTGLNFPIEPGKDANSALLEQLLPTEIPTRRTADGRTVIDPTKLISSLTLKPFGEQIANRDFMGRKITDPKNKEIAPGVWKYEGDDGKSDLGQRAKHLFMGLGPLANESDATINAFRGTEDYYGKVRSPLQGIGRAVGFKSEKNTPDVREKKRSINAWATENKKITDELKTLSPSAQTAWGKLTGQSKLREQKNNPFDASTKIDVKKPVFNFPEDKWKEYVTNPELYDLMQKKKYQENKPNEQGKRQPIPPEFDKRLSSEFRKQLINNKSLAPGEDVEADQRMYSMSEWGTYDKIKKQYQKDSKAYYPDTGEFNDELVKHKSPDFPEKGPAKAAYDDAYARYSKGKGPKPTYTDQVSAEKEAYSEAKRAWTNGERKARGLPPIPKEVWDNVSFGFESDEEKIYKELKYGRGFGKFGSGSSQAPNSRIHLTKGNVSAPKVSVKGGKLKSKLAVAKAGKPKISIKKSLV